MRCQKFFLTRFITKCLIFVFFLNCVITAEAGVLLGQICFNFSAGSENKTGTDVRGGSENKIYVIKSKTIEEDKEEEKVTKKECTIIEKVCEKSDLDCLSTSTSIKKQLVKIQLKSINRDNPEKSDPNCYHYRVFISPGIYRMQCDNDNNCISDLVISHYGSSQRDINFTISGKSSKCEESPVTQHIETSHE